MCSHYDPVLNRNKLQTHFKVTDLPDGLQPSLWPSGIGPFVRRHEFADVGDDAVPSNELLVGSFGLVPFWADIKSARHTYNARSETVHEKNTFKDAWRKGRHCIIPAEGIFEPDWRSGKAVPTRIVRSDGKPMGIAGLWERKPMPDGALYSFTMLTLNADDHPFMKNYHQPSKEKRMLVILADEEYDAWLDAGPEDSQPFIKQFPAELMTVDPTLPASR